MYLPALPRIWLAQVLTSQERPASTRRPSQLAVVFELQHSVTSQAHPQVQFAKRVLSQEIMSYLSCYRQWAAASHRYFQLLRTQADQVAKELLCLQMRQVLPINDMRGMQLILLWEDLTCTTSYH